MSDTMTLEWPSLELIHGYTDALKRGWSPDNLRSEAAAREALEGIESDPATFVASLVDKEAKGAPVELPDGTTTKRLPGYHRWIWDGGYCGTISIRWQPGTEELPPTCLGHIGYAVVPWKRNRGYSTRALGLLLPEAKELGMHHVIITTDPENLASQKVIHANGGVLQERFELPDGYGMPVGLRYKIDLTT